MGNSCLGFSGFFFLNDLPKRGFVSVSDTFRSALSEGEHLQFARSIRRRQ